jgi:hypothetical protein
MTGAAFCNVDPAYTCTGGGSWWPFVAGVVILAGFAGWRVRPAAFRRCGLCGVPALRRCAPDCFCPGCVEIGGE